MEKRKMKTGRDNSKPSHLLPPPKKNTTTKQQQQKTHFLDCNDPSKDLSDAYCRLNSKASSGSGQGSRAGHVSYTQENDKLWIHLHGFVVC